MIDPSSSEESDVEDSGDGGAYVVAGVLGGGFGQALGGGNYGGGPFHHPGAGQLSGATSTSASTSPAHSLHQQQQQPQLLSSSYNSSSTISSFQTVLQQSSPHHHTPLPSQLTPQLHPALAEPRSLTPSSGKIGSTDSLNVDKPGGRSTRSNSIRPISPSPSLSSVGGEGGRGGEDSTSERSEREDEDRRRRLQLYVFVIRCIAYPFNAKQPTDMARRQAKVTRQQLQTLKERFLAFLNGELTIPADEAFINAVQSYYEVFLRSDRVVAMVKSGSCSANDFREVFKNNIEKRVRGLPEIDGLSKETVLGAWMAKFDQIFRGDDDPRKRPQRGSGIAAVGAGGAASSEMILTKEQLYDMFQHILGVKKYEHQILYNALQDPEFNAPPGIGGTKKYRPPVGDFFLTLSRGFTADQPQYQPQYRPQDQPQACKKPQEPHRVQPQYQPQDQRVKTK